MASINRGVGETQKLWQFAQLSRDHDAKTKDHVSRIQAQCAEKAQESMHKQTHSCLTTSMEGKDSKRSEDDHTFGEAATESGNNQSGTDLVRSYGS